MVNYRILVIPVIPTISSRLLCILLVNFLYASTSQQRFPVWLWSTGYSCQAQNSLSTEKDPFGSETSQTQSYSDSLIIIVTASSLLDSTFTLTSEWSLFWTYLYSFSISIYDTRSLSFVLSSQLPFASMVFPKMSDIVMSPQSSWYFDHLTPPISWEPCYTLSIPTTKVGLLRSYWELEPTSLFPAD